MSFDVQIHGMPREIAQAALFLASDAASWVTGQTIAKVTTGQIYWGSIPFIVIQIAMVVLVLLYPGMVTHYKADRPKVNIENISIDPGNFGGYGAGADGQSSGTSDQDYNNMFK